MKRLTIVIIILLSVQFLSCNKKIDKENLVKEIQLFSGLKINPKNIDSVKYESDFATTTYVIYLSDFNLKSLYLESQKINGFEFYSKMDSFSSFTESNKGCIKQLNINLTKKWIIYGEGCH